MRWLIPLLVLGVAACGSDSTAPLPDGVPLCAPDAEPLRLSGRVTAADAKTYRLQPFGVAPGTGRIELAYGWSESGGLPATPLTATTLDLGLWDADGYRTPAGFRGWSGSRQGRIDLDQAPVFVEAAQAERGYVPGAIEPGVWHAELGIAAVSPQGADWELWIDCKAASGAAPANDPVDPRHVARDQPGWYHGDFHMHAYHSNANAPDWAEFIEQARAARLDFVMVTEYVTGEHWRRLGALQRANPDLVIWPGREIITYFGHANTHGETPSTIEYRHGFEDVHLGEIQRVAAADGALFQVNHPTSFPGLLFENFCRGCAFTLGDDIDWDRVDTIEILNGPVLATAGDLGIPIPGVRIENPFMRTAIRLWEEKLAQGHRITGVSGSDSKGTEPDDAERRRRGYGSSVTAVYAQALSRPALTAAIRAGHAYVRTRGVAASPELEFRARTDDGQHAIFGDTLRVGENAVARAEVVVRGAQGQRLYWYRNGSLVATSVIDADPYTEVRDIARHLRSEGRLGTMWRIETGDEASRTTLGNPIFLASP
ncbi:CehA/McbA family metallohydrolase [Sinimarinibacterium thermocellulolyticum]|uniref:CehA/McbA family metallohydrolase n=1 Tax=Sinimarinibacterium thermocellulolyticum TaxID=3170016 RepID=A0ABV2AD18_9GAMM